ncbi:Max Dimerization Protein 3 [Manis pentadactyla]|nr:Max Dimerization Protein 3 [Manis pentadactyla]
MDASFSWNVGKERQQLPAPGNCALWTDMTNIIRCGADVAPSDPQQSRARPREPRARAVSERRRRLRPPVPGHVASATARKTASAEQVESAPLRPGKVSPAAVRGSWRGVRPPSLEGQAGPIKEIYRSPSDQENSVLLKNSPGEIRQLPLSLCTSFLSPCAH